MKVDFNLQIGVWSKTKKKRAKRGDGLILLTPHVATCIYLVPVAANEPVVQGIKTAHW